jgi:hypothetical protein
VVNSDRQKYVLEFDVKCPGEASKKAKKKSETTTTTTTNSELP